MKSFKIPTKQQIEAALERIRSPEHAAYFFSRLENPNWIAPLEAAGLFKDPPNGVLESKQVTWPQSRYLARVAASAPVEVVRIFHDMETTSHAVVYDVLAAADLVPAVNAVQLVPFIRRANKSGMLTFHFDIACKICARLAAESQSSTAMKMASFLFRLRNKTDASPRKKRDYHDYIQGLKTVIPALIPVRAKPFLQDLIHWQRIAISYLDYVDPDAFDDSSEVWRPAIEDNAANGDFELAAMMIGCIRDGCELAVNVKAMSLGEILSILDKPSNLIFKRLKLHLVNKFFDLDPQIATAEMMRRELFDNYRFKPEYARLMSSRFSALNRSDQELWFSWVDAGPDMTTFNESFLNHESRPATEEERRLRKASWQLDRLHWVQTHLAGERLENYRTMLSELGEPELSDLNFRAHVGRWGLDSPITVAELESQAFEEAIERVARWKPSENRKFFGPSLEGLGQTFGEYIGTDVERFSNDAHLLKNRKPIFVRHFIEKMSEGVTKGKVIAINPVLQLCNWVVQQPMYQDADSNAELEDRNWIWARDCVASLLRSMFQARSDGHLTYSMENIRETAVTMLRVLTEGPSKSNVVYDGHTIDPRAYDFTMIAINSSRGKALQALFAYVRWVNEHLKMATSKEDSAFSFEHMPEVREILDWQIATANRCFEGLAIIGENIPLIQSIDPGWLRQNTHLLFDLQHQWHPSSQTYGWAAWNSFLCWTQPRFVFYELFRSEFAYAVIQGASVKVTRDSDEKPMNRLGEHLIVFYGRGQLTLDQDGRMLRRFLTSSMYAIRSHAVTFVGHSLDTTEDIPSEIIERFMELWDWYWNEVKSRDVATLTAYDLFGSWFVCRKFPIEWSILRLRDFVQVVALPEPDEEIVERLLENALIDIASCIEILECMVHGDEEGWHIYHWSAKAKELLKLGLKDDSSNRKSKQVIDYLGRRGFNEFTELLRVDV